MEAAGRNAYYQFQRTAVLQQVVRQQGDSQARFREALDNLRKIGQLLCTGSYYPLECQLSYHFKRLWNLMTQFTSTRLTSKSATTTGIIWNSWIVTDAQQRRLPPLWCNSRLRFSCGS